jgi:hypothetical protein
MGCCLLGLLCFFSFPDLLFFFYLPSVSRKKRAGREGKSLGGFQTFLKYPFCLKTIFKHFCKYFGLIALIKIRKDEKGLLRNQTR